MGLNESNFSGLDYHRHIFCELSTFKRSALNYNPLSRAVHRQHLDASWMKRSSVG